MGKRNPLKPLKTKDKNPKHKISKPKSNKSKSKPKPKPKSKPKPEQTNRTDNNKNDGNLGVTPQVLSPLHQRNYFITQFESATGTKLSSIELDSIPDTCFVKLPENSNLDAINLGKHVKDVFGSSWKKELCESQLIEGQIDPGNPTVLVVSSSAIKSLELFRGFRPLTKECQAVKLFSKHIKIDDQVAQLKNRVNIASGTPSRMKKLCEMEALGLSRLSLLVLDMRTDVKGYSLLTLPQVRDEFWDLYKTYFHNLLVQGNLRVCLYGPFSMKSESTLKKSED